MIDALELSAANVTLDLFLTPNDAQYVAELRARSADLSALTVHDPVPYTELIQTLNAYDLGVFILEPLNFSYRWALPNKLFDFVQARIGMIVGPSPEMVTLVNDYQLGTVADGFTAAGLAKCFDALIPEEVLAWKRSANAAASELSSETQVQRWRDAIDRLLVSTRD